MPGLEFIPVDVQKLALVLLLSFLIGLEHEEHRQANLPRYLFGGVRTFPLLGIIGYTSALLAPQYPAVLAVGFGVVGALMYLSFQFKLGQYKSDAVPQAGITSEASGLLTFLLGAVVVQEHYWIATALVVIGVMLLELKVGLEDWAHKISAAETFTFTKFLLLTAVILPALPNTALTRFQINPQHVWLIVIGISTISYASYILQKWIGDKGAIPSAILGGAYSSTAATIALAKRSVGQFGRAKLYSGAILVASGVMYLRLAVLVSLFSTDLRLRLAPILCVLGVLTLAFGILWARRESKSRESKSTVAKDAPQEVAIEVSNPLAIHSAVLFAGLFIVMFLLTHLILDSVGALGVYGLSVITGVTDVDPFILGMTQSAGHNSPVNTAIVAILLAASSNNFAKGFYARAFAEKEAARMAFTLLCVLTVAGLLPIGYFLF